MSFLARSIGFIGRILRGEDVTLVHQTSEKWEEQYKRGRWDRLAKEQLNTEWVAAYIQNEARGRRLAVLDVGCGNGGLARFIAALPNVSYCGIDISETAISAARRENPEGQFCLSDAGAPSEGLGMFDIVIFNEVLYYVGPHVLARYKCHVVSGGAVVISMVRFWRTRFLWRRVRKIVSIERFSTVRAENRIWDIAVGKYR